ncbi:MULTISPECIES: hypothetical protein [Pseudomonas]
MGLTLGPKAEVPCEQASKVRPVESLLDRAPLWDEASWQTWRWLWCNGAVDGSLAAAPAQSGAAAVSIDASKDVERW